MSAYINFLILKNKICESNKVSLSVDLKAQQLLEEIFIRHGIGQPMNVGDAMALDKLGSPASLHRKIDDLRLAGLIQMDFKGNDRRTKYLIPTDVTNEYFQLMSHAFIKALIE